jgi:hypothetical protein
MSMVSFCCDNVTNFRKNSHTACKIYIVGKRFFTFMMYSEWQTITGPEVRKKSLAISLTFERDKTNLTSTFVTGPISTHPTVHRVNTQQAPK